MYDRINKTIKVQRITSDISLNNVKRKVILGSIESYSLMNLQK